MTFTFRANWVTFFIYPSSWMLENFRGTASWRHFQIIACKKRNKFPLIFHAAKQKIETLNEKTKKRWMNFGKDARMFLKLSNFSSLFLPMPIAFSEHSLALPTEDTKCFKNLLIVSLKSFPDPYRWLQTIVWKKLFRRLRTKHRYNWGNFTFSSEDSEKDFS